MSAKGSTELKKKKSVNFLSMVPKRKARWRRVTEESLKRMAKVENKGFVRNGGKPETVRQS